MIISAGATAAGDFVLPSQSNAGGSFVIVDNRLAHAWGYLLGYPDMAPRWFRQELYQPGLPTENLGTYQSIPFPHPIANTDRDWRAIYCNDRSALLLDHEGGAWFVPFATATTNGSPLVTPAQIEFPTGVTSWLTASVANQQGCLVSTSGDLSMLGPNWTNTVSHLPAAALPWPRFVSCDVKDNQAIALDDQGSLYGWGYNWQGMLGSAATWTIRPTRLHASPDGHRWQKVALGAEHAIGLSTGGR
jgi:hypothetical protein